MARLVNKFRLAKFIQDGLEEFSLLLVSADELLGPENADDGRVSKLNHVFVPFRLHFFDHRGIFITVVVFFVIFVIFFVRQVIALLA